MPCIATIATTRIGAKTVAEIATVQARAFSSIPTLRTSSQPITPATQSHDAGAIRNPGIV